MHTQPPNPSLQHLLSLTLFCNRSPSHHPVSPHRKQHSLKSNLTRISQIQSRQILHWIQTCYKPFRLRVRSKFPLASLAAMLTFVSCKIWPVLQLTMCFLQWCECKCCWASMINWHQHKQQFPFASSAFS